MFGPVVLAFPLVGQLLMVSAKVPSWNVTGSCRAAPAVGAEGQVKNRYKDCLTLEQHSRDKLAKNWTNYPANDRITCVDSIKWFEPTYSELLTCLEMKRDLRNNSSNSDDVKP
jgi:hypothetical protein